MAESQSTRQSEEGPTMVVHLRPRDADAILALAEWALNNRPQLGPGIRYGDALDAVRRIEAVADLYRKGIEDRG